MPPFIKQDLIHFALDHDLSYKQSSKIKNALGSTFLYFIGCDFYFDDTYIGIVEDIVTFSGNDLLLVKTNEGKEHYIPINKKLIKFFDIEDQKLVMNTIEGLLDIC